LKIDREPNCTTRKVNFDTVLHAFPYDNVIDSRPTNVQNVFRRDSSLA
jgi:hypothetical protein